MLARCSNPENEQWADYGGRGIAVCERWRSFGNFLADMGVRPDSKLTLERRDNDGDYEPDNCYWADRVTQLRNRRKWTWGRRLTEAETHEAYVLYCSGWTLKQLRDHYGIRTSRTLRARWLRLGWVVGYAARRQDIATDELRQAA
jgi:hypothetical protein